MFINYEQWSNKLKQNKSMKEIEQIWLWFWLVSTKTTFLSQASFFRSDFLRRSDLRLLCDHLQNGNGTHAHMDTFLYKPSASPAAQQKIIYL